MTHRHAARDGRHPRPRRSRGFTPACERVEPRTLLAATAVVPGLAPGSDSGLSPTDEITNVRNPTLQGEATAYSIVQVFGQRAGDSAPRLLGQTEADPTGAWALTVGPLADGVYHITDSATDSTGFPASPSVLIPALIVDTSGPRVAALSVDAQASQVTVVFQDAGAGLAPATLLNRAAYTLESRADMQGVNPTLVSLGPAVTGDYTTAIAVTLTFPGLVPGRGRHYTLGVTSGGPSGISDVAGNPLDGEFSGRFPSGDGTPGGNFLANFTAPSGPAPRRR